jgi:hypothetical protein
LPLLHCQSLLRSSCITALQSRRPSQAESGRLNRINSPPFSMSNLISFSAKYLPLIYHNPCDISTSLTLITKHAALYVPCPSSCLHDAQFCPHDGTILPTCTSLCTSHGAHAPAIRHGRESLCTTFKTLLFTAPWPSLPLTPPLPSLVFPLPPPSSLQSSTHPTTTALLDHNLIPAVSLSPSTPYLFPPCSPADKTGETISSWVGPDGFASSELMKK